MNSNRMHEYSEIYRRAARDLTPIVDTRNIRRNTHARRTDRTEEILNNFDFYRRIIAYYGENLDRKHRNEGYIRAILKQFKQDYRSASVGLREAQGDLIRTCFIQVFDDLAKRILNGGRVSK